MCVKWTNDWEIARKAVTVFKAVRKHGDHYLSSVAVSDRDPQQRAGTLGKVLEYRKGQYADGEEPGIYCFETPAMAKADRDEEGIVVIKVRIPKGTRIRRGRAVVRDTAGQALELLTVNAMRVKVLAEMSASDCKSALWPLARPVSDQYVVSSASTTWTYFTMNAQITTNATYWTTSE